MMNPIRVLRRVVTDVGESRAAAMSASQRVTDLARLFNERIGELESENRALREDVKALLTGLARSRKTPDDQPAVMSGSPPAHLPQIPDKDGETNPADFFNRNGYYIFRNVLDPHAVENLVQTLDSEVARSDVPFYRHQDVYEGHRLIDSPEGRKLISNAILNPHRQPETPAVAQAIRELVCNDRIADLLQSADGAPSHTIHQTLVFFTSPATDMHTDGWGLDSQPYGHSYTLWIPLEHVTLNNGALALVPWPVGSFISPKKLGLEEFLAGDDLATRGAYHQYFDRFVAHIRKHHPACVVSQLEPGDMVFFASQTPHATMPTSRGPQSRVALQIMLRDSSRAWASWSQQIREGTVNPPGEPNDRLRSVNSRWRLLM